MPSDLFVPDTPATVDEPTVSLAIPDPRVQAVPVGWATDTFAVLADSLDWADLDEAEAKLLGLASYIESLRGDNTEMQKALRIVEFRRGVLLGEPKQGKRSDLQLLSRMEEVHEVAGPTASRYRQIARNWDATLWPHLIAAKDARDVSQAALLRLCDEQKKKQGVQRPVPAAKPNPDTDPASPDTSEEDTGNDLVMELEEADKTIRRQQTVIESLEKDDLAAQVVAWADKYARLEGRLQQEITTGNEKTRIISSQKRVLEQVRLILKVPSNSEIMGALQDLVR